MRGLTGVAGQRALSAGTLLIAAGGLALYQVTSLVLGPGGSRQFHVSLTIPAADADERAESWSFGINHALGMVVAPAPSATAPRPALGRPAQAGAAAASAPAPIGATLPALPVSSKTATRRGHDHPQPPKHHCTD